MNPGSLVSGVVDRLRALPTGLKVVVGVGVVAVLAVASVLMYRTYDYVQHDNQFCLECHLMEDPFERFAQSAHRGLGCKACHRPNIVQRSEMGLAQIVVNPDSIRVHAHVPNEICAECHIEGDPDEWRRVAATAGHRIHLESDDPALRGLNCVECHSSGVHQFTPTDQTCGQGGCHESIDIQLGDMADLTIHCATCHDFATPVAPEADPEAVATSLRPQAEECLSCHQMRSMLADLPADEPHNAECGACHNPHQQRTPEEAVQSCATGGCHAQPDTLTPYHRGLDPGVLDDCTACHEAHTFRIHMEGRGGENCLECHQDIYDDSPPRRISAVDGAGVPLAAVPPSAVPSGEADGASGAIRPTRTVRRPVQVASAGPLSPALARLALAAHPADGGLSGEEVGRRAEATPPVPGTDRAAPIHPPVRTPVQRADSLRFWHSEHRGVECTSCHTMQGEHGALTVTSITDCRSCHHAAPVANDCSRCHARPEMHGETFRIAQTLQLSAGAGRQVNRTLPFRHGVHADLNCSACHTRGLTMSGADVRCDACHERHHEPNADCMACHVKPPAGAHDLEVHLGCAGSGCHEAAPASVRSVPRTRDFCLVCHQDMTAHRPGRSCEQCHALPRPRAGLDPTHGAILELAEVP